MKRPETCRSAFTIVELLVVVSIIGLLMGILLPALSGVKARAAKAREQNNMRQVGIGWSQYAVSNNDAAIPGYLDPDPVGPQSRNVIEHWNVRYKFPDKSTVPDDIAAPWTWRLIPYVSASAEIFLGHLNIENDTIPDMIKRARQIAEEPSIGYNGYYTGGWWQIERVGSSSDGEATIPRFSNVPNPVNSDRSLALVAQYLGSIERQTEYIVFCTSGKVSPGLHKKADATVPGSFIVTPPYLADDRQWGYHILPNTNQPDPNRLEAFVDETRMPIGRYTEQAAVMYADGHVGAQKPLSLQVPRQWINTADEKRFGTGPREFIHAEDNPY